MESRKRTKRIFSSLVLYRHLSTETCGELSEKVMVRFRLSVIFFGCAGARPQAVVRAQTALLDLMDGAVQEVASFQIFQ